jgi:Leucine-rich repeat (LRR) protein
MWDELPGELWLIVFWYLVDSKALVPAAGVCQRWRRLCRVTSDVRLDARFPWQGLFENVGSMYNVLEDSTGLVARAATLRELQFAPGFSDIGAMVGYYLSWPYPSFRHLTRLDLSGTAIDNLFLPPRCPLLTHINLRDCKALRGASMLDFVHLETINFAGCSRLLYVDMWKCESLKTIDLTDCVSLQTVKGFSVTHVMLAGCSSLTDDGFDSLLCSVDSVDQAVTHMNISGCHRLTDIGSLNLAPRLTHLDMSGCTHITDIDLLHLTPRLTHLDMSGCTQITDISVLQECTALTSVNLRGCTALIGAGNIAALANLSFEI